MIRLGIVQAPSTEDISANLRQIRHFAEEAASMHCAAVCFPECSLTGYAPENSRKQSVSQMASELQQTAAIAKEYQLDLLVGFMERCADHCYLTHGIFRADGTIDFYRKTHLGQKELRFFQSGNQLPVFSLSCGLHAGFQMCVETHFPEITQTLSLKGADVIFAPHAVPSKAGDRKEIWSKFIPARSYDNRVYMACCNQWDGNCFGGGCLVTDPKGEEITSCFQDQSALVTFEVDVDLVRKYHDKNAGMRYRYYPEQRRPELYV